MSVLLCSRRPPNDTMLHVSRGMRWKRLHHLLNSTNQSRYQAVVQASPCTAVQQLREQLQAFEVHGTARPRLRAGVLRVGLGTARVHHSSTPLLHPCPYRPRSPGCRSSVLGVHGRPGGWKPLLYSPWSGSRHWRLKDWGCEV